MTNPNKKFLLILWVIIVMIYYLVKSCSLVVEGDMDAALVYTIGMAVITVGMVWAAKLGDNTKRFKIALSLPPLAVLTVLLLMMSVNWISWERNSSNRLQKAAAQGDIEGISRIMEKYDSADLNLQWALQSALHAEQLEAIDLLIEKGADINGNIWSGDTALEYALFWDKADSFMEVLKYDPDLSIIYDKGKTILHKAVIENQLPLAEALLDAGMDVNTVNEENGWTPLHYAADSGYGDMIRLLIDRGSDLNPRTHRGRTPLMLVDSYKKQIREELIQSGAWDMELNSSEQTALHTAAANSDIAEIRRLLKEGKIIIDFPDDNGMTPLCCALESGNDRAVRLLLENGADVQGWDDGSSPLAIAVSQKRSLNLLDEIIESGFQKDETSYPLQIAVYNEDLTRIQYLLEKGFVLTPDIMESALQNNSPSVREVLIPYAPWSGMKEETFRKVLVNAVTTGEVSLIEDLLTRRKKEPEEKTGNIRNNPLTAAAKETDSREIMTLLVNAGYSLETKDQNGRDLFFYAFQEDHPEILGFLLDHSSDLQEGNPPLIDYLLYDSIQDLAISCTKNSARSRC